MVKIIGSAQTFDGLKELIKKKWYWSTVNTSMMEQDERWAVANNRGIQPYYIIKRKNRYYFIEKADK